MCSRILTCPLLHPLARDAQRREPRGNHCVDLSRRRSNWRTFEWLKPTRIYNFLSPKKKKSEHNSSGVWRLMLPSFPGKWDLIGLEVPPCCSFSPLYPLNCHHLEAERRTWRHFPLWNIRCPLEREHRVWLLSTCMQWGCKALLPIPCVGGSV